MKNVFNINGIILLTLLVGSCNKNHIQASTVAVAPVVAPVIVAPVIVEAPFNWCGQKVACWGDSFTEGPGGWPYPLIFASITGRDSVIMTNNQPHLKHGDSIVFNGGKSGETSIQIRDRFLKDTIHKSWATVIWSGANNNWDTVQIAADIDTMVKLLHHDDYIILSILTGNQPYAWKGSLMYDYTRTFNARMAFRYKEHFIDLLPFLQSKANKSPEDSLCLAHDISPTSLRRDDLHLNPAGYQIVAESVAGRLKSCL